MSAFGQNSQGNKETGSPVDFYYWTTGQRRQNMPPISGRSTAHPRREPWQATHRATFNDYRISGTSIEASMRGQDDWHFEEMGQGAFRFDASNAGGGLVIALTSSNMDDINGYFIVLDDDNHESYVLQLASLGSNRLLANTVAGGLLGRNRSYQKVPGVSVDPNFRLTPDKTMTLHVLYQNGQISVGLGGKPGHQQILHMSPQSTHRRSDGMDLNHYGFARLGKRWPSPIRIFNVETLKYVRNRVQPMPANSLQNAAPNHRIVEPGSVLYQGGSLSQWSVLGGKQPKSDETWGFQRQQEYSQESKYPSLVMR